MGVSVDDWLERLDLTKWACRKVEALSKGMSQKVQFIAAVIGSPELLILDEPFSGLDPVNRDVLRKAVLELRTAGSTIIFSTHDMSVAEKMCDTICMIYQGNKVLDGSMSAIQSKYVEDTLRLRAAGDLMSCRNLPGVREVSDFGQYVEVRLEPSADPQQILRELVERFAIQQFEVTHPSLHDIFVRIASPEPESAGAPGS